MPDFLCGCCRSELRSSRLHGKHFNESPISPALADSLTRALPAVSGNQAQLYLREVQLTLAFGILFTAAI